MLKIKIIVILSSIFLFLFFYQTDEIHFERDVNNILFINEEESIPAFDTEITDYYAHSFSSLKKNNIRFGNKTYFYKKRNIQKNEIITLFTTYS